MSAFKSLFGMKPRRQLLLALYTVLRSLKMYPVENATVQKSLDDLDSAARALLQTEVERELPIPAWGFGVLAFVLLLGLLLLTLSIGKGRPHS